MLDHQLLFAALDVSLEKTTVCVMSLDGTIVKEAVVPTAPEAISAWWIIPASWSGSA